MVSFGSGLFFRILFSCVFQMFQMWFCNACEFLSVICSQRVIRVTPLEPMEDWTRLQRFEQQATILLKLDHSVAHATSSISHGKKMMSLKRFFSVFLPKQSIGIFSPKKPATNNLMLNGFFTRCNLSHISRRSVYPFRAIPMRSPSKTGGHRAFPPPQPASCIQSKVMRHRPQAQLSLNTQCSSISLGIFFALTRAEARAPQYAPFCSQPPMPKSWSQWRQLLLVHQRVPPTMQVFRTPSFLNFVPAFTWASGSGHSAVVRNPPCTSSRSTRGAGR